MSGFFHRIIASSLRKIGPPALEAGPATADILEVEEQVFDLAAPEPSVTLAPAEAVSLPARMSPEPAATSEPSVFPVTVNREIVTERDAPESRSHELPKQLARSQMPEPPPKTSPARTPAKEDARVLRNADIEVVMPARRVPDPRVTLSSLGKWLAGSRPSNEQADDGERGTRPAPGPVAPDPAALNTVIEQKETKERHVLHEKTHVRERATDRTTTIPSQGAMQPASVDSVFTPPARPDPAVVRAAARPARNTSSQSTDGRQGQDIVIHNLEVRVSAPAERTSEPQREARPKTPAPGAWEASARYYLRKV